MAAKQVFDFTPTAEERQFYGQLFKTADTENNGVVPSLRARDLFLKSGLSSDVLRKIWTITDPDNQGFFTYARFTAALRLLAHAQNGRQPDPSLINTEVPLVRFEGISLESVKRPAGGMVIPEEEREYYKRIFLGQNPRNGLLEGEMARQIFMKSKLPLDTLAQIWTLADAKQRGQLDLAEFIVAMYFIKRTMDKTIDKLPTTLPSGFYEMAARQSQDAPPFVARQMSGASMSPALTAQLTGGSINPVLALPPVTQHSTGLSTGSTSPPLSTQLFPPEEAWDITDEAKAKYDKLFDGLDKVKRGFITGDEGVNFFLQSTLPHSVLAQIWDLANITKSGNLNRDEFAVAMHLIMKRRSGEPLPTTIPNSLIPPSMRVKRASAVTSPALGPRASIHSTLQVTDIFDGLTASGPSLKGPLNDVADLFGSPDMQTQMALEAGEVRSMQAKAENAEATVTDLKNRRDAMETSLATLSNQKRDASLRLAQLRTLYDSQFKAFQEVEAEYKKEHGEFERVKNDLVLAERALASLQLDREQLQQAMNRDREDAQELKKQIRITEERTSALKSEIEKIKKDSRQQKGLITINKKQLATVESEYEKTKKVLDDLQHDVIKAEAVDDSLGTVSNPAAQVPLPQMTKSEKDAINESPSQPTSRDHSQHGSLSSLGELELKRPMSNASIGSTSTQSSAGAKSVTEVASKPEDQKLDSSGFGVFGPPTQTTPSTAPSDPFNVSSDGPSFNGDLARTSIEQADSAQGPGMTQNESVSVDAFADFKFNKPATDKDAIAAAFGAPSETKSIDTVSPDAFASEYPTLEELEKSVGDIAKLGFDDDFTTVSVSQTNEQTGEATTPVVAGSVSNGLEETPKPEVKDAPGESAKSQSPGSAEVGSQEQSSATTANSGLAELASGQDDFDAAFRDLGEAKFTTASAEFDTAFDTFDDFNPSFDSPVPKDNGTLATSNNLDAIFKPDFSSEFGKSSTPAELDAPFGNAASVFEDFDPFSSSNNQTTTKSQPNLDVVFGASASKAESGPLGFEDTFAELAKPVKEQTISLPGPSGTLLPLDLKENKENQEGDSEQVKEIVSMGFNRKDVVAALERYDYDKEKATNFLLDHPATTEKTPSGK